MSTERDVTRIVRSWLDEGATAFPDRVLDQVLDQVPATSQRRSWWPAWRFREMNIPLKLAIAATAAAVVVAAAIGINVMTGAGGVGGSPAVVAPSAVSTPAPTPTSILTPSPTFTPRPAATEAAPTPEPSQVDLGWPGHPGSPAGRYSWDPDALGFQAAKVKGSLGFSWMHNPDSHLVLQMSTYKTDYGPGPTEATVGGYDATYQEPSVNPDDPDVRKRQVWIVDIDGTPVTIVVDSGHDASVADLSEARAVIDSIRVERTDSRIGFKLTFDLQAGWDSE